MVTKTKELAGLNPTVRRMLAQVIYGSGNTAPTDGVTGAGHALTGSIYVDSSAGNLYRNDGTRSSPQWVPFAGETTKLLDDESLRFGDYSDPNDESVSDARLWYDSTEQRFTLTTLRASATDPAYASGLFIDADGIFTATGARKSRALVVEGDRTAVMGGDAHDMIVSMGYTNYAVNTPAGSYARGQTIQMTNRTTGALSALQGMFVGVRQRSSGGVGELEGIQVDVKVDAGMAAPTSLAGYRAEIDLGNSAAPTVSYGVVADNRTDGALTPPTAAFKAINRGTSGCKGFEWGVDLMSAAGQDTVNTGEIRLSAQDANNLPLGIFAGQATDDAGIVAQVGADTLWADGSAYFSAVDGAGKLFMKQNDVWTDIS